MSKFLDEDVPQIADNIGALVLVVFCIAVGSASVIAFLMWLV